jgi:hypothetical protein
MTGTATEASQPAPGLFAEPSDWEDELFQRLGVTHPTAADRAFFEAWFTEEHGQGGETGAKATGYTFDPMSETLKPSGLEQHGGEYNPFDTTLPMAGASSLNSVGVQNYPTPAEGYEATVDTLEKSDPSYGYAPIVAGLRGGASLTQLEKAEAASSWGNAFPSEGPVATTKSTPGTASSIGGPVSGVATEIAGGIVSALRDLLEMLGGAALVVLGAYMIVRDLEGAGVPLGRAARPIQRALSPTRRRARGATRATTEARTETARTRVAETRTAREHVGRRTEATTRTAEQSAALQRARVRQEQARARQEEEAARVMKASGTAAGGTSPAAKRHERTRQAGQREEYRRHERARTHDAPYNQRGGRLHAVSGSDEGEEPF